MFGSAVSADCVSLWIFVAQSVTGTFTTLVLQAVPQCFLNSSCIAATIVLLGTTSADLMMKTSACPFVFMIAQSASHRAAVVKSIGTSAVTLGGNGWWMSNRCVTVTGMCAALACFSCGWRKYGFGAAWRSMRSTFCAIAWLMPWTHCDGCPWVGNSVNLIPNLFATFCI